MSASLIFGLVFGVFLYPSTVCLSNLKPVKINSRQFILSSCLVKGPSGLVRGQRWIACSGARNVTLWVVSHNLV